ncbi:MAG: hypothetical protein LUC33_01995 [Prevotellaceae bacterium]|nr:hypothetical protein [Prevotellaceae bacterium]
MRKYIKPSTEVISTETQRMIALSAINDTPAIKMDGDDGDGLVKSNLWDNINSFWN